MRSYLNRASHIQENNCSFSKTNNFKEGERNSTNAGTGQYIQKSICKRIDSNRKIAEYRIKQVSEDTSSEEPDSNHKVANNTNHLC
jgi:hypothetical protein